MVSCGKLTEFLRVFPWGRKSDRLRCLRAAEAPLSDPTSGYCMSPESSADPSNTPAAADHRHSGCAAERPTLAAVPETGARGLLDSMIGATSREPRDPGAAAAPTAFLDRFLEASSHSAAVRLWFGRDLPQTKDQLARTLNRDIALLDGLLSDQLNAVIHHPRFKKLEASWQGLHYLVDETREGSNVKIRVLNVSWKELARDAEAFDFDQSQLFRKVYSGEFGVPGGEPFGVLIGDYEIRPGLDKDHPVDDVATLRSISHVSAAAFAPFVAAAHPSMFGLEDFTGLERTIDLQRIFDQKKYLSWQSFRKEEDSRFVGLTMPRVLARLPYEDDPARADGFRFREDVSGPDRKKYLWGNAAFAFAGVLVRAFAETGWFADIRGVRRGIETGGLVTGLPAHSFATDRRNVAQKASTDVVITDILEKSLSELGFIPLCHCKDTEFSAFYTNASVQRPKKYDRRVATVNARMSAMLQYMLCVSRFSHYLKVITRDNIGSFIEAKDCEDDLTRWLANYITPDTDAAAEVKSRHPLREAKVEVRARPGGPGTFDCVVHLWPHYELDDLTASIRVKSELAPMQE